MIKSLHIQNIQSHEDSLFEFSSGVNIIIGSSDSGKTASIRALRKLVWNKPSGSAIVSSWGGNSNVQLATDEGTVIWNKDKTDSYTLNIPGKKDLVFKAFGTDVPEEISRFLNLSEVNLQMQLDAPFLLSNTPGEVAKHFNRISRIDKIDTATSKINSSIRELGVTVRFTENLIVQNLETLKQFEHLEKFEMEVESLEVIDEQYSCLLKTQTKLESFILKVKDNNSELTEESKILQIEDLVDSILTNYQSLHQGHNEIDDLIFLKNSIKEIDIDISETNKIASIDLTPIFSAINAKRLIDNQWIKLDQLIKSIKTIRTSLVLEDLKYRGYTDEWAVIFPDICPLCGENHIHE